MYPAVLLFLTLGVYYNKVFSYFIGGDDISSLINAPQNAAGFIDVFTRIQQYRPLPASYFTLLNKLPFNTTVFHVFTFLFVVFICYSVYLFLVKFLKLNKFNGFIISFCYGISHIIFYLVFTLAGICDLLFLTFFWFCLIFFYLYFENKKTKFFILSLVFFLGSFFTKEIIITIPIIISLYIFLFNHKTSKNGITKILFSFWTPTIIFYGIKIVLFKPISSAYTYSFHLSQLLNNVISFILWILNYKHGWQMGMALQPPVLYFVIIILYGAFACLSIYQCIRTKRRQFIFLMVWFLAGLIPFLFLQRILVYYLDVSLIAFLSVIGLFLQSLYKKTKRPDH